MKQLVWLVGLLIASILTILFASDTLSLSLANEKVSPKNNIPISRHVSPLVQLPDKNGTLVATKLDNVFADTGLKAPNPVLVMAMSKAGTTTAWRYFLCGGQAAAHLFTKNETGAGVRIGQCMGENAKLDRPVLQGCGSYTMLADIGAVYGAECYYPMVHGLEALHRDYPTATWLHIVREAGAWADSLLGFYNIAWKMATKCDGFPRAPNTTKNDWMQWYRDQTERVRQFAIEHPSLTYIEVRLESPSTAAILEQTIGINGSCWGMHNVNAKRERSGNDE